MCQDTHGGKHRAWRKFCFYKKSLTKYYLTWVFRLNYCWTLILCRCGKNYFILISSFKLSSLSKTDNFYRWVNFWVSWIIFNITLFCSLLISILKTSHDFSSCFKCLFPPKCTSFFYLSFSSLLLKKKTKPTSQETNQLTNQANKQPSKK